MQFNRKFAKVGIRKKKLGVQNSKLGDSEVYVLITRSVYSQVAKLKKKAFCA